MRLTTTHQLSYELQKMIGTEYERIRDNLATGSAFSFDEYQRQVGKIQGLSLALEFVNEAKAIADGETVRGEN
jgi:hypothetical protein